MPSIAASGAISNRELYIGGQWTPPVKGQYLDVVNPATGASIGRIPGATKEDVNAAVADACAAHAKGAWAHASGAHRASVLRSIASKIRENSATLANVMTQDMGKPMAESGYEVEMTASCFEYYAGLAEKLDDQPDRELDIGRAEFRAAVKKEPLGVVAAITPWNFPLAVAAWKLAPALAAGNCVVLKPSEVASLACLELGGLASEAGLPPGVLNVVTGTGPDVGAPLSSHPDVSLVAFTGSGATGRHVATAAAANLRPSLMELGGKGCMIIMEDADLDQAVEWAMFGIFWNCGQVCSATSRVLVEDSVADTFLTKLKSRAESLRVNDPLVPGCQMGPVVNASQYQRVCKYLEIGKEEGALLLTGGRRPPDLSDGFFLQPTVFSNVKPDMRIWKEEIFGPVLTVTTFRGEDEAIRLANDTEFGLAGAVMSRDEARCKRVANALQVGTAWINCCEILFNQTPWGGVKDSGYGRELGEWGLDSFMTVKTVTEYKGNTGAMGWYNMPVPT